MPDETPVRITQDGDVTVVTLHSPATRNALSLQVLEGLHGALTTIAAARPAALVLAGDATAFSAGGEMREVHQALAHGDQALVHRSLDLLHTVVRQLRSLPLATVAAVEGVAVGGGIALALAADVRIAGPRATFVPGYLAIGASPDGGASYQLARSLGGPQALAALVLNRPLTATDLLSTGLVQEIVDAETDALARAITVAQGLTNLSPEALVTTRRLIDQATTHSLDTHLDTEAEAFTPLHDPTPFLRATTRFAR